MWAEPYCTIWRLASGVACAAPHRFRYAAVSSRLPDKSCSWLVRVSTACLVCPVSSEHRVSCVLSTVPWYVDWSVEWLVSTVVLWVCPADPDGASTVPKRCNTRAAAQNRAAALRHWQKIQDQVYHVRPVPWSMDRMEHPEHGAWYSCTREPTRAACAAPSTTRRHPHRPTPACLVSVTRIWLDVDLTEGSSQSSGCAKGVGSTCCTSVAPRLDVTTASPPLGVVG